MRTVIDIEDEVYKILVAAGIRSKVNGVISKDGRPANSEKEDVIISALANEYAEYQRAYINVNVYIVDNYSKELGRYIMNRQRVRALCDTFKELLAVNYKDFRLTLETQKVYAVEGKNEHVLVNKLYYQSINQ